MSMLSWVRGNSVLMAVTLTQKKTDGTTEAIDLSAYDEWAAKVWRLSAYKKQDENVDAALDVEGHVVLSIPSSLGCGSYSVEVTMEKEGYDRRSYETPVFRVVESNGEADVTYDVVQCQLSADIEMTFQLVPIAETLGKNAYELWKELPGNEDKTLQEYIDEVLDLNGITKACVTATEEAEAAAVIGSHPDYIGEDNYVYHWTDGAYVKTDIYCKGDKGDPGSGGGGVQSDWNQTDTSADDYIKNKPTIPSSASDVGAVPTTRTVNGKALSSDITLSASDVSALPSSTVIPDVSGKADKATTLAGYGITDAKIEAGTITLGSNTITPLTSHQDISGKEDKLVIDSTAKTASFTASVGKYYTVNVANDSSVAVTLPTSGFTTTDIQSIVFLVTLGSGTASCTFSPVAMTAEGSLDASSTYEVNALWNGTGWYISFVKLVAST